MISCLSFKPPLVLQTQEASAGAAVPFDLKIFSPGTDKDEIYALRYRAFIEAGLIPARADRRFSDAYDDLDTTTTIAAFDGTACVGTFRLAFGREGGARTMPCQSIFAKARGLRRVGFRPVEFTRMVVAPELTNTSFRTTLYATLVRAGLIVAHAARADFGLISINPSQVRFYEMMCGFSEMARGDDYPGITAPAVLLGRDFRALDAKRSLQNRFFKISEIEIARARALLFPERGMCEAVAVAV
jgi:Acetyltransferase (GNAT) domain